MPVPLSPKPKTLYLQLYETFSMILLQIPSHTSRARRLLSLWYGDPIFKIIKHRRSPSFIFYSRKIYFDYLLVSSVLYSNRILSVSKMQYTTQRVYSKRDLFKTLISMSMSLLMSPKERNASRNGLVKYGRGSFFYYLQCYYTVK